MATRSNNQESYGHGLKRQALQFVDKLWHQEVVQLGRPIYGEVWEGSLPIFASSLVLSDVKLKKRSKVNPRDFEVVRFSLGVEELGLHMSAGVTDPNDLRGDGFAEMLQAAKDVFDGHQHEDCLQAELQRRFAQPAIEVVRIGSTMLQAAGAA
jgi:hypothetical protein